MLARARRDLEQVAELVERRALVLVDRPSSADHPRRHRVDEEPVGLGQLRAVDDRQIDGRLRRLVDLGDLLEIEPLLQRGADDRVGLVRVELAVGPADGGERQEHVAPEPASGGMGVPPIGTARMRSRVACARRSPIVSRRRVQVVARGADRPRVSSAISQRDRVGVLARARRDLEQLAELLERGELPVVDHAVEAGHPRRHGVDEEPVGLGQRFDDR